MAASVKPSERQKDWYAMEKYIFCHFGVNTFTGREWGDGTEDEKLFNPTNLDCDQWVEAAKAGGFKGIVITAKHHDGFCLWPSKYTEHSVKNSPFKGDVVKEVADACKRGGIKFGFYLSPWDRNSKYYGTPEYNDYYCNQLTELLTNYGEVFMVWFDGACGEGPNGKKQEYDYKRYIELIRKYQPNACIFSDYGPDVRWIGNESGKGRTAEWAVLPSEFCCRAEVQTGPAPMAEYGTPMFLYNIQDDLGSISKIMYSKGLTFVPAEVDTTIKPHTHWFWHPNEEPRTVEDLFEVYKNSVGQNACLNLNIPPNQEGKWDESDVKRLKELKDYIDEKFKEEAEAVITIDDSNPIQPVINIKLPDSAITHFIVLEEDLDYGQRIESYMLRRVDLDETSLIGTTVGNKKIIELKNGLEYCLEWNLHITSSRDIVKLKSIKVYK